MKKTLIAIIGPTASGKTSLSINIAKHFQTEIINVDSRQFYKEMSIGTAKPSKEEQSSIPHHFIDSHSVTEDYNAGQYEKGALICINQLFKKHDQLVLVGGSGLYLQALLEGFDDFPEVPNTLREELKRRVEKEGVTVLANELKELDPESFECIDSNNSQRVRRALEVCIVSGKKFSSFKKKKKQERPFNVIKIGIDWNRANLYERINHRVHLMMESGLLDEVKTLLPYKNLNALQTVGYRELISYIDGECSLEEAIQLIQRNSRRYAKRQITWFGKDDSIEWFTPENLNAAIPYLNDQLNC